MHSNIQMLRWNFMEFSIEYNHSGVREGVRLNERVAVRAVIFNENRCLFILTNKGDYKLPGGGVKQKESLEQACIREIQEETGYQTILLEKQIGTYIERKWDEYEDDTTFQMTSHYYQGRLIDETIIAQNLDTYERELDYTAVWVTLEEAIQQNERALQRVDANPWVQREVWILKEILKMQNNKLPKP